MRNAYIVTGTLTDVHTVALDEALPLTSKKVRLVIEPLSSVAPGSYQEIMATIRQRQQMRGHRSPARDEVDTYIHTERKSWGE